MGITYPKCFPTLMAKVGMSKGFNKGIASSSSWSAKGLKGLQSPAWLDNESGLPLCPCIPWELVLTNGIFSFLQLWGLLGYVMPTLCFISSQFASRVTTTNVCSMIWIENSKTRNYWLWNKLRGVILE